ncbi:iron chelate uptake ABC transporter family permease subunit [Nocardiopsis sp. NPDC049922]|uniref:FecCD family ABC transporter permease n=1 Tax=Nocardiopsis sp. NPDC049922 TaxID=3155157 RepID=UPI0033C21302
MSVHDRARPRPEHARPRVGGAPPLRVHARSAVVGAVLLAALACAAVTSLMTGEFPLTPGEVLATLVGRGAPGHEFVVLTLRMPRLLTALAVGAALAVSGAVLQRLLRNPLGSPDFIGLTEGSATGALVVIVMVGGSMLLTSAAALVGGLTTAALIYLLAFTRGVRQGRFVLVGIGIGAMALAANSYLITRARLEDALAAQAWLVGSLGDVGYEQATAVGAAVAVFVPIAVARSRALSLLEMGDDTAAGLGVRVERCKLVLIVVSVALAAVATAATGPILFVALTAPQLARRLTRTPSPGLVTSALTGALLLLTADLLVGWLFPTSMLPVGTATGLIGGLYLVWLLASQRRGRSR